MAVIFYARYACQTCSFMSAITYEASRTSNKSTTDVQTMDSYIHRHTRSQSHNNHNVEYRFLHHEIYTTILVLLMG